MLTRIEWRSRAVAFTWVLALLVGLGLRIAPLTAGRPYLGYVDEGHALHPAIRLLREGGWDPRPHYSYYYPQFPTTAALAAMRLYAPVYERTQGKALRAQIPAKVELYDDLEPYELLLIGRILCLSLSLSVVVLAGLLARRLAGRVAGAAAALVAAVTPALVLRSPIATVDPYATFFVLGCLFLTDVTRTSKRPGLVSFAAGIAAGFAFGSKYPSVLVIGAFGLTTLLRGDPWLEKARRLGLATAGLLLGGFAAMPAAFLHVREVDAVLRWHAAIYKEAGSVPLWTQAFQRAEWTIPYDRPELGFVLVAAALAGVVIGLMDRRIAPTVWGWCAFAAVSLGVYSRQAFQPFRNLLPLVPLVAIAASLFFAHLRRRIARPLRGNALAAVAIGWLLLAFVLPLSAYARDRQRLRDPRKEAIDWLVANAGPRDEVLVVRDLGILNQELSRLRARKTSRWEGQLEDAVHELRPRFVVAGVLSRAHAAPLDLAALPAVARDYVERVRLGTKPTVPKSWWRGNHQLVVVLERRPEGS